MKSRGFTISVTLGLLILISVCLWGITRGVGTPTEALLLSVILTIFSVLASWVVSNYYANYSYDENVRIFGLKAAEKVTNLSNELARLSVFLQQELDSSDYDSPREELLHRDARIEAAIHIINTLKSVNDRSLSDWQGIIGEEISAQRAVQEKREENLRDLLERLESLPQEQREHEEAEPQEQTESNLLTELEAIKKDLRLLATQVSGTPLRAMAPKPQRQNLQRTCPACSATILYRQRPSQDGTKSMSCKNCNARLYSRYTDGDFVLSLRTPEPSAVTCPACGHETTVGVDPIMGSFQVAECPMCAGRIGVTRTHRGIAVKVVDSQKQPDGNGGKSRLTEELLQEVVKNMPPQPWPTGTAKDISHRLGITPTTMSAAITELVRRGVFKLQVNGVLYVPTPEASAGRVDILPTSSRRADA